MITKLHVKITTPLNPTESRDRVEEAIRNLFPNAEFEERHGELVGETHSLDYLAERLDEQDIVDTAREVFFEGRENDAFGFDLKKQAAYEGVVNFAVGNPDELGDLRVRVRVEEPDVTSVIDDVAPGTEAEGTGEDAP